MPETRTTLTKTEPAVVTNGIESPPLTIGPKRLHYQYSIALPQAHLTFVSIVQGIAFGVLIQGLPLPNSTDLTALLPFLSAQHAYLPWIISGLAIVIIWKQFVQASIVYVWPLSTVRISLMLLLALVETSMFRELQHIDAWIACLGLLSITAAIMMLSNRSETAKQEFEDAHIKRFDTSREAIKSVVFLALGAVITVSGLAMRYVPVLVRNASVASWVALVLLLGCMIGVAIVDKRGMGYIVSLALRGSDLTYVPTGTIKYRPTSAQERLSMLEVLKSDNEP